MIKLLTKLFFRKSPKCYIGSDKPFTITISKPIDTEGNLEVKNINLVGDDTSIKLLNALSDAIALADEYRSMISGESWEGDPEHTQYLVDENKRILEEYEILKKKL